MYDHFYHCKHYNVFRLFIVKLEESQDSFTDATMELEIARQQVFHTSSDPLEGGNEPQIKTEGMYKYGYRLRWHGVSIAEEDPLMATIISPLGSSELKNYLKCYNIILNLYFAGQYSSTEGMYILYTHALSTWFLLNSFRWKFAGQIGIFTKANWTVIRYVHVHVCTWLS